MTCRSKVLGSFHTNSVPLLTAAVYFCDYEAGSAVSLLVDTGSTNTVIHPADAKKILGPNFEQRFHGLKPKPMTGIGKANAWPALVNITFSCKSRPEICRRWVCKGKKADEIFIPQQTIWVAVPGSHNQEAHSLLGRDLIHYFDLLYSFRIGTVKLTHVYDAR